MPTFQWDPTSWKPHPPVLQFYISFGASTARYLGQFSSHWCQVWCYRSWTTALQCSAGWHSACNCWWTWLIFASSECDHIMPLLRQLHWLKVPVDKLQAGHLVYKCLHCLAPSHHADELHHPSETEFRSASRFISWTVYSPYPTLNLHRLSFSSCRCTDLEQSSTAYHICSITSCLPLSPEDILLRTLLPVITVAHEVTLSLMDTLITLTYLLTYPISLQHTDYILYSQSLSQFYTWRLVVNNIHHTPDPSYHLSALLHTRQCKDTMMTCTVKYIHNYKTNSVDQKLWTMMTLSNLQSELWPPVTLTFDILTPKLTVSWSCPVDHLCHFAAKSVQPFCNYCVPKFDPFWPPVTLTFDLSTPKLTISCPYNADHLCHFASKLVHLFSK